MKWGRDHTPAPRQLADQRRHAAQRYAPERVVQIALVQSGRVVPPEEHGCRVATWAALRAGVASARRTRAEGPTGRILSDRLAVLDARGLDAVYLDSLPALRLGGAPLPPLREEPADAPLPPLPDVSLHPEARFTPWS